MPQPPQSLHPPSKVRPHRNPTLPKLRVQGVPCCQLPLSPHAPIPYPTPMPTRTRPTAPHLPSRPSPTPQGVGAELALPLTGGCSTRPLRGAFSLSGGCSQVVPHGIRFVGARRGSNPCSPHFRASTSKLRRIVSPKTAISIQAAPSHAAIQPRFNLKAAPSLPRPRRAVPRHGRPGEKTRGTIQLNSNRPHPGFVVPAEAGTSSPQPNSPNQGRLWRPATWRTPPPSATLGTPFRHE